MSPKDMYSQSSTKCTAIGHGNLQFSKFSKTTYYILTLLVELPDDRLGEVVGVGDVASTCNPNHLLILRPKFLPMFDDLDLTLARFASSFVRAHCPGHVVNHVHDSTSHGVPRLSWIVSWILGCWLFYYLLSE